MQLADDYKKWINDLKIRVRNARLKAASIMNEVLVEFYWNLGKMISEKMQVSSWGDKVINQIAKDLRKEFPNLKGLSATNLKYCRRFYEFYSDSIGQQLVDQLDLKLVFQVPWGHNILIFTRAGDIEEAIFYLKETITHGWNRNEVGLQLKSKLYLRKGKAPTNFSRTLNSPHSELAQQSLKDPYIFDFLNFSDSFREKELEDQLVTNITKFLLELGKGFAFIGRQYHLEVVGNDYYLDLLFYHVKLKCYVVIELKNTKFIPEYAGKLNFYLSAVDSILTDQGDNPTIGILLCQDKNNVEVEFALRDINKPMGVSEFQFTEILPEGLKSSLPTVEEIEEELSKE